MSSIRWACSFDSAHVVYALCKTERRFERSCLCARELPAEQMDHRCSCFRFFTISCAASDQLTVALFGVVVPGLVFRTVWPDE